MSVENTSQLLSFYSGAQVSKGLAELSGLHSTFLNEIQKQQKKEYEQKESPEPSAAEIRRENAAQNEHSRSEHLRGEKKTLNKSELRSEQSETDYNEKREYKETRQKEMFSSVSPSHLTDFRHGIESLPLPSPSGQEKNIVMGHIPQSVPLNSPVSSAAASLSIVPTVITQPPETAAISPRLNGTIPQFVSPVSDSSAASVFTVFTASGQLQKTPKEEKEEKKEEKNDKKKEKKKTFVSLLPSFEAKSAEKTPTLSFLTSPKTSSEKSLHPAEERQKQTQSNPKTEKDISLEALLKRLEKPVPFNEPVPQQMETAEASRFQEQNDRVLFVQRIAAACQSAANQKGTIRMKLDLGTLGSVTLWAATKDKKMSVRFETQQHRTTQLLSENIEELRGILTQKEIYLENVEIETND